MNIKVPWNAGWSSEARYEVRPCRWVGGRLALWSPHTPGVGKPIFAKPHMVRQRRSIAEMRCTVCGPGGYSIARAIIGGPAVEQDFGIRIDPARGIIGSLKLAWPASRVQIAP